ncbi:enediyne polyketide synthase [Asanoa ferruginea]|uniref:Enediyne polyketide synthase n=1 Tax=Asanoa ferruginea TaxID=53367 RepID=A0A3D9ZNR2_9ACTN|nr:type I polyketide synthase [Asanoa ferruginea]REF98891.1 enediyne polyketide synthase [Asanoa ferruginea]GIF46427.1 polyketide synthase [Asanoa ferruginea]
MANTRIAIVGLACQYPEAAAPALLWRNVLAGRRSFREIPPERLNLDDYHSPDRSAPDATYNRYAALLDDYQFDRVAFNVPGPAYRSSDIAHWLALDVAKRSLDDAGFADLPIDRRRVSVLMGNTLTGDYTRSGVLRLRWPYVRRAVAAALAERGLADQLGQLLPELERTFKEPFQPINEESLAGGLSNTIAGRICNFFDFGGGGYTIDGACSSSLLTVIHSAIALQRGDVDLALAGGVDLSIDPFELVGFAKTSALAETLMRIYDERSEGFWPGEGCGVVTLVREADAIRWGLRVYATITGFGISSDGHGGITRPEVDGHALAMRRAYDAAGYGPDLVELFEGHGTGTRVGDAAEVAAISRLRRTAGASDVAALGSIKANIGHTKAAAGVAGLIKVVLSVHSGVLPPTTGSEAPLAELRGPDRVLEVRRGAREWSSDVRRAAVSAVGFGGINTHVTVEQSHAGQPARLWAVDSAVASTGQDAELIPFAAASLPELARQSRELAAAARDLTFGRMSDLAVHAARATLPGQRARAAVVARTPKELAEGCAELADRIEAGVPRHVGPDYSFSASADAPRIGFVFSGQGSPVRLDAGSLGRRFPAAQAVLDGAGLPDTTTVDTAVAQPATVAVSAAALAVLGALGVEATVAVGHSLGELTALHWAGVFTRAELIDLATTRGRAMAACTAERGAMVELGTDVETAADLIADLPLSVAAVNAADRTVVSGAEAAIQTCRRRAATRSIRATPLRVSHAFHSDLVAPAAPAITAWFPPGTAERVVQRPVVSTVTGAVLSGRVSIERLLVEQVTAPVLFTDALEAAADRCDLLVEVGPGRILADLAAAAGLPALSVDAGAYGFAPFLGVVGAAYALGSPVALDALVANRIAVVSDPLRRPTYLVNPCEQLPAPTVRLEPAPEPEPAAELQPGAPPEVSERGDIARVVRDLIAARTELPADAVSDGSTFLVDLKLNSIAVAQIAADAARDTGREPLAAPHELAEGNVRELIEMLERSPAAGEGGRTEEAPGAGEWVRTFAVDWVPRRRGGPRRAVAWELPDDCPPAVRAVFGDEGRGSYDAPRGLVLSLEPIVTEHDAIRAIQRLAEVADDRTARRVVVCHSGGAASLVRTLHAERPDLPVRLLDTSMLAGLAPGEHRQLRRECEIGDGFEELRLDDGRVTVPRLVEQAVSGRTRRLGAEDTVLVTGGGKGIGAEAALALGRTFGARVAVVGRSDPDDDAELAANLDRMRALGVPVRYERADITDPASLRAAVRLIENDLGPVTGVVHAAGVNEPGLLTALDPESIAATWRTKVDGLRQLTAVVDPDRLRLLVVFSSLIGRTGMRGEGHYAVANERVRAEVAEFAAAHPECKCLSVDWSVWSGVGMGAKLGVLESLVRAGIRPIPPEAGIATLLELISADGDVAPIVSGRFGLAATTLPMRDDEVPFLRFVEKPLVRYPGIELVVEATLARETDRYLADHALNGALLFPMVAGLEAMAQVAHALTGRAPVARVLDLRLSQPISVPVDGTLRIQIAGLVRPDGLVDVCVRSEATSFGAEHFRATFDFDDRGTPPPEASRRPELLASSADIVTALYSDLLFHGPRFQLARGFRRLESVRCRADVDAREAGRWFVDYLPQDLLLGDLAARDASLHAAQSCIPHRRLLPAGADEVRFRRPSPAAVLDVESTERGRGDRDLVFDLTVRDDGGAVTETWRGMRLRAVDDLPVTKTWPVELIAAYLERTLGLRWGAGVACRVTLADTSGLDRDQRGARAVALATGDTQTLVHRPDGKPELVSGAGISLSHAGSYTLALVSDAPVGVDLEPVGHRPRPSWQGMLGATNDALAEAIAESGGEDYDVSATRVWSAVECLRKLGEAGAVPLRLDQPPQDGWCTLSSGPLRVTTAVIRLPGLDGGVVVAAVRRTAPEPATLRTGAEAGR